MAYVQEKSVYIILTADLETSGLSPDKNAITQITAEALRSDTLEPIGVFNKYVYPTAPKFKSFITCSCGKSLNLNDYYNFCPNCGIKCIKKSEELERHEREKESYNYQVNEIRKAFIEDVLVDIAALPETGVELAKKASNKVLKIVHDMV